MAHVIHDLGIIFDHLPNMFVPAEPIWLTFYATWLLSVGLFHIVSIQSAIKVGIA